MPRYDAFVASLNCWRCQAKAAVELQTDAMQKPAERRFEKGDKVELIAPQAVGAYGADIVLRRPDMPGFCNLMMGWTCPVCKLVNWALVAIRDFEVAAIEALALDSVNIDRVHVLSWDPTIDDFLFRNRGMDCRLKSGLEVECACEKRSGQVMPFFGLEDVLFEDEETASPHHASRELARQVGPQVVFGEIRDKMAQDARRCSFGPYDIETLKRELVNADREYRSAPEQYPRRLKVYGRLPER